ncbi:flagellar hook-basal body complex protein [Vibrio mimicus]|uniref:flagellar hook-basal body complex protein n=1 Tax=Vibrio mimicus TaxID=674 RepID=UPI0011D3446D|nr:flagellar hook-basal body complex protein [Vibrio mimicus]TXZ09591.1 flagellar hook-basal body complex protein [Vibrio mimicus]
MFQSFYNGLSGMQTSSKALDIVSDNVANMQTPGFKANDVFMASVNGGGKGLGSQVADVGHRYTNGEVAQTGNRTDAYLDGRALFVLKSDGEYYYTRAGMFTLNENNVLVDRMSGYEVIGINGDGNLGPIKVGDNKSIPAVASTTVSIRGEITKKDGTVELEKIGYIASDGSYQQLTVYLDLDEATEAWAVSVTDEAGNEVGSGSLEFDLGGTLKVGKNQVVATLADGQVITVGFGEAGSLAGVTLREENEKSEMKLDEVDGSAESPFSDIGIGSDGTVTLYYGNGEKREIGAIGVAKVDNYSAFKVKDGHLLQSEKVPEILHIGRGVDANIIAGALELSNVDLAQEFGDMMVIQRSYQASSRVMSISNQLIEQLYNSTGG